MSGIMARPNNSSRLPNMMPKNSVAKCERLRMNTRKRNRVANRRRSGSAMPLRFERCVISRRRNCSGVAPSLRIRPINVIATSSTSGTMVVNTSTPRLNVVWYGGKLYEL